jgi:hypothetical protein
VLPFPDRIAIAYRVGSFINFYEPVKRWKCRIEPCIFYKIALVSGRIRGRNATPHVMHRYIET